MWTAMPCAFQHIDDNFISTSFFDSAGNFLVDRFLQREDVIAFKNYLQAGAVIFVVINFKANVIWQWLPCHIKLAVHNINRRMLYGNSIILLVKKANNKTVHAELLQRQKF